MKILRIGSFHGAPYRYVNLFMDNPDNQYTWIYLNGDNSVENLISIVDETNTINNVIFIKIENFLFLKLNQIVSINLHPKIGKIFFFIYKILFKLLIKLVFLPKSVGFRMINSDFIWVGNNDLDYCLGLASLLKYKYPKLQFSLSYQEHRSRFRLDEKLALHLVDKLIIPSSGSLNKLEQVYNNNYEIKTKIANEDWRSDCLRYNYKKTKNITPKILIISNFAEYGEKSDRRGSRVNYLNIIKSLIKQGAEVDLYVNKICQSFGYPDENSNTPYHLLSNENQNFKLIKGSLKLNFKSDYIKFYNYDYGVLHNFSPGEKINNFNEINIPNRMYEYINMGIKPIVIKNTLLEAEKIVKQLKFGVILENYHDLMSIHENENNSINIIKHDLTFENFIKICLN